MHEDMHYLRAQHTHAQHTQQRRWAGIYSTIVHDNVSGRGHFWKHVHGCCCTIIAIKWFNSLIAVALNVYVDVENAFIFNNHLARVTVPCADNELLRHNPSAYSNYNYCSALRFFTLSPEKCSKDSRRRMKLPRVNGIFQMKIRSFFSLLLTMHINMHNTHRTALACKCFRKLLKITHFCSFPYSEMLWIHPKNCTLLWRLWTATWKLCAFLP